MFKIRQVPLEIPGINKTINYPLVEPSGNGLIDVKNNFQWKNNITSKDTIDEVPSILLTEYTLPYGMIISNLTNILKGFSSATATDTANRLLELDPYLELYRGVKTGFKYNLPYIIKPGGAVVPSITNSWKELSFNDIPFVGGALQKLGNTVEDILDVTTSGFGFDVPMIYSKTSKRSLTISFPLYNTVDVAKTQENYYFVQLLSIQSLKIRTTFLTYIPPKIYKVEGLGLGSVVMPAAYISNLNIESIGATREVRIEGGVTLIPEAYKVTITLKEMVENSANIMNAAIDKGVNQVSVISVANTTQEEANSQNFRNIQNLGRQIGNLFGGSGNNNP